MEAMLKLFLDYFHWKQKWSGGESAKPVREQAFLLRYESEPSIVE